MKDSPVEQLRKTLPQGDGQWAGFDHVYTQLQKAANHLAQGAYTRCSEDHVEVMATMGSGHEETMKGLMHKARVYGWLCNE